jgi:hypothetical protein
MKLIEINSSLAETNAELNRIAAEIAGLPPFQRGGRHHTNLSESRQQLLRRRKELRALRQMLFQHN